MPDLRRRVETLETNAGMNSADALFNLLDDDELAEFITIIEAHAAGDAEASSELFAACDEQTRRKFERVVQSYLREGAH